MSREGRRGAGVWGVGSGGRAARWLLPGARLCDTCAARRVWLQHAGRASGLMASAAS